MKIFFVSYKQNLNQTKQLNSNARPGYIQKGVWRCSGHAGSQTDHFISYFELVLLTQILLPKGFLEGQKSIWISLLNSVFLML